MSSARLDPMPKVSIIMATFNCVDTVESALDSIVAQTYTNWELVICDDGSADGTFSVLRDRMAELGDDRGVLLRNPENRKLAYSLNRCLEVASGELVARMDGDDLSHPERLETQVKYLQQHPGVDLVGTSMRRFNEDGPGEVVDPPATEPDKWILGRTTKSPFFHATILARRTMFAAVGNYTVSWRTQRGQDLDLWFKFFAAGMCGRNMLEPLYWVREDAAAIRRRTPRVRLGSYLTRLRGNWALRFPISAYLRCTADMMMKVLLPYQVFDWHRKRSRLSAQRKTRAGGGLK